VILLRSGPLAQCDAEVALQLTGREKILEAEAHRPLFLDRAQGQRWVEGLDMDRLGPADPPPEEFFVIACGVATEEHDRDALDQMLVTQPQALVSTDVLPPLVAGERHWRERVAQRDLAPDEVTDFVWVEPILVRVVDALIPGFLAPHLGCVARVEARAPHRGLVARRAPPAEALDVAGNVARRSPPVEVFDITAVGRGRSLSLDVLAVVVAAPAGRDPPIALFVAAVPFAFALAAVGSTPLRLRPLDVVVVVVIVVDVAPGAQAPSPGGARGARWNCGGRRRPLVVA
jgi:hypothetical protein